MQNRIIFLYFDSIFLFGIQGERQFLLNTVHLSRRTLSTHANYTQTRTMEHMQLLILLNNNGYRYIVVKKQQQRFLVLHS